mmetsp:Transcript_11233/g.27619  ORF Transcript_11233/g.27619 Transcript_11233/m.27619 type:complete len:286 (-) Transcript_11233:318-1175(-)
MSTPAANAEGKTPAANAEGKDAKEKKGPELRQAEWTDFSVGVAIYIRGRRAEVLRLDHPLVYWVYEGEKAEKHRSFGFDKELFKVEVIKADELKTSGLLEQPLCRKIHNLVDDELDCVGVTAKHSVEIKDCKDAHISILGEVYGINLINCTGVTLLFSSLVASCDLNNCTGCKVFCQTECCLFDIQECTNCTISIAEKLLSTVLFSTINGSGMSIAAYDKITAETVEIIKDGEELDTIVTYEIPTSASTTGEVELRTKWNGKNFETKTVETKDISPDYDKEYDPL